MKTILRNEDNKDTINNILERFKKEKIAVSCKSRKDAELFIKLCYENNLEYEHSNFPYSSWGLKDIEISYEYSNGCLYYSNANDFKNMGYEMITYEKFIDEMR